MELCRCPQVSSELLAVEACRPAPAHAWEAPIKSLLVSGAVLVWDFVRAALVRFSHTLVSGARRRRQLALWNHVAQSQAIAAHFRNFPHGRQSPSCSQGCGRSQRRHAPSRWKCDMRAGGPRCESSEVFVWLRRLNRLRLARAPHDDSGTSDADGVASQGVRRSNCGVPGPRCLSAPLGFRPQTW